MYLEDLGMLGQGVRVGPPRASAKPPPQSTPVSEMILPLGPAPAFLLMEIPTLSL